MKVMRLTARRRKVIADHLEGVVSKLPTVEQYNQTFNPPDPIRLKNNWEVYRWTSKRYGWDYPVITLSAEYNDAMMSILGKENWDGSEYILTGAKPFTVIRPDGGKEYFEEADRELYLMVAEALGVDLT